MPAIAKLILKMVIFSVLVFGTIFGVIYLPPVDDDKYIMALVDKHRMLAETPRPRIIFAGDSNLAFGLNSRMVHKATGYNVVNMGLHGGLGLVYSMDELMPYLGKGDVVIFIPDYTHYLGTGIGDNTLVEVTILMPRLICYYSKENIMPFISNIPLTFQRRLRGLLSPTKESPTHRRSGFNEFGDNEGHIGVDPPEFKGKDYIAKILPEAAKLNITRLLPDHVNDTLVRRFNDFSAICREKGVMLYVAFSPLMEQDRRTQVETLTKLEKDMRNRLQVRFIGTSIENIYPQNYFFDNEFHLNGTGREVRTRRLINAMKADRFLSRPPGSELN